MFTLSNFYKSKEWLESLKAAIDDSKVSNNTTWSSQKIKEYIDNLILESQTLKK